MDYNEFTRTMEEKIQQDIGNHARVQRIEVAKNNGVNKDGLKLSHDNTPVSPVIYLSDMYQLYQDGASIEECISLAASTLQKGLREKDMTERFVDKIRSWEECREKLYPIILNRKANEELLKDLVYKPYLDLVICYSLCLDETTSGTASIKVHWHLLKTWGITEEELHHQALQNLEHADYHLTAMWDILKERLLAREDEDIGANILHAFTILTNGRNLFGAAGILKKDLLYEFAAKTGRNLFLIPSSIHELLILQDNGRMAVQELNDMIMDVNEHQLKPEEILSDHAYYYDRENQEVRIAE